MEKRKGRRSATAAEETKILILTAAADMFCELGYERVSIRNISERAGVSHSLIRHHFGSKEQIWYSVSDHLHAHMQKYILHVLSLLPEATPANVKIYRFAVELLAQLIVFRQPMQFMLDAMRQENEFFDYFIDSKGEIECIVLDLVEQYNQDQPDNQFVMHELKWQMMMFANGSASMLPMLKETIGQDAQSLDQALVRHWHLFEQQTAATLCIPSDLRLSAPARLEDLVHNISCSWEDTPS